MSHSLLDEPWPDPIVVIDAEPDLDADWWEAFRQWVPCRDCGQVDGLHCDECMTGG